MNKSPASDWLSALCPFPGTPPAGFSGRSLCGQMQAQKGWVEACRQIYDHELILIESGIFEITIDGIVYPCEGGSFLIIPPGTWHTTRCIRTGKRHYAHFDWEHWPLQNNRPVMTFAPGTPRKEYMRPAPRAVPKKLRWGDMHAPARACTLMNRLRLMLTSTHPEQYRTARAVLLEILILLLDEQIRLPEAAPQREDLAHRVRMRLDQMELNADNDGSVCEALAAIGYSYEHLARLFRKQYGVSPVGYLQSLRIEKAKSLLLHSRLKVEAIATEAGYQDSVYFTRLFKRHTGTTPARFRKHRTDIRSTGTQPA